MVSVFQSIKTVAKDIGYLAFATAGQTVAATAAVVQATGGNVTPEHLVYGAIAGFSGAGAAVLADRVGNPVSAAVVEDLAGSDDLLRNADWAFISGLTIAELIRDFATGESITEAEAEVLVDLANKVEEDWDEIVTTFDEIYQATDKSTAIEWFRASAQFDPSKRRVLDPDTWFRILDAIAKRHACQSVEDRIEELAQLLPDEYAQALYRVLKNQEVADRAYRGLLMSTLSSIHESTCDVIPQKLDDLKDADQEILDAIGNIGPGVEAAIRALMSQLGAAFDSSGIEKQLEDQNQRWSEAIDGLKAVNIVVRENNSLLWEVLDKLDQTSTAVQQLRAELEAIKLSRSTKPVGTIESERTPTPRLITNIHQHQTTQRRFINRPKLMRKLKSGLRRKRRSAITQTKAIHGLGGVGKTQLALEYALKQSQVGEYEIIWWIRAESNQTLLLDLCDLGIELGLPDQDDKANLALATVLLIGQEQARPWILIYDNAKKPGDLARFLPNSKHGDVLVTSRETGWDKYADSIPVDVMDEKEAVRLLLSRSGSKDRKTAQGIAQRLGYLPLALEIAGAYCDAMDKSLDEYGQMLGEMGVEALDDLQPDDYHAQIAMTWQPSILAAVNQAADSLSVLKISSFLDAENIPRDLFVPLIESEAARDKAFGALLRFSLIQRGQSNRSFSIHRLVQEVLRRQLDKANFANTSEVSLQLVDMYSQGDLQNDLEVISRFKELLAHVETVSGYGYSWFLKEEKTGLADSFVVPLVNNLTNLDLYFSRTAQFNEAEKAATSALKVSEASFGENHPKVAIRLNNLASLLEATNRHSEAEPMMRRALEIDEASYGEDHPEVAVDLNNLASLLKATNRHSEAEPMMRRHVRIFAKFGWQKGHDHPHMQAAVANYEILLSEMGMNEEQILERIQSVLDPESDE